MTRCESHPTKNLERTQYIIDESASSNEEKNDYKDRVKRRLVFDEMHPIETLQEDSRFNERQNKRLHVACTEARAKQIPQKMYYVIDESESSDDEVIRKAIDKVKRRLSFGNATSIQTEENNQVKTK